MKCIESGQPRNGKHLHNGLRTELTDDRSS
jgi:hypothetical protein